jgi:pimeloyl-ACP methyl ester carboxylesterase
MDGKPACTEHRVPREQGRVYARDYDGTGPAFVLMHGFPDNLRIYDDLIPYLTATGRRVVAFDFLGFGASDKPVGASYSFEQQLGDLSAVIQTWGSARSFWLRMIVRGSPRLISRSSIRTRSPRYAFSIPPTTARRSTSGPK